MTSTSWPSEVGGQRLDVVEVQRVGVGALSVNSDDNLRLPLAGLAEVSDRFDPTTSPAALSFAASLAVLALIAAAAAGAWRRTPGRPRYPAGVVGRRGLAAGDLRARLRRHHVVRSRRRSPPS